MRHVRNIESSIGVHVVQHPPPITGHGKGNPGSYCPMTAVHCLFRNKVIIEDKRDQCMHEDIRFFFLQRMVDL